MISKTYTIFILLTGPLAAQPYFNEVGKGFLDEFQNSNRFWAEVRLDSTMIEGRTSLSFSNNGYFLDKFVLDTNDLELGNNEFLVVNFTGKSNQRQFSKFALGIDLEGFISDLSPSGQDIIMESTVSPFSDGEFMSSSVEFSEVSRISFSNAIELKEDFTVGYWVRPSSTNGWAVLGNSVTYYRIIGHNSLSQISLFVPNVRIDLSTALEVGEWQYVALVRKSEVVTVFLDGSPVGSAEWSGWLQFDQIGGTSSNFHWSPFVGSVSEVIIFDYPISADDVIALMEGTYMPGIHAPFQLDPNQSSSDLFLSQNGNILDHVQIGDINNGQSQGYATHEAEASQWVNFMKPSPGQANASDGLALMLDLNIAEWRGDKKAAVSVHFDDNLDLHFTVAQPIMDSYGVVGTFHLVTGWLNPNLIALAQGAVSSGHEIGSHSMTHPRLTDISFEDMQWEIRRSKELVEEYFMGVGNCFVMAYPSGSFNEDVINELIDAGFLMGRKVGDVKPSISIKRDWAINEFFRIGSSYTVLSTTKSADFLEKLDDAISARGWFNPMFHGIVDRGWEPLPEIEFRDMMSGIAERDEDLWIATVGDVIRYSRQRLASTVYTSDFTDNVFTVQFSSQSDDLRLDVPLTVLGAVPEGRIPISIRDQDGVPLEFKSNGSLFQFDRKMSHGPVYVEVTPPKPRYQRWILGESKSGSINSTDPRARIQPDYYPNFVRYSTGIDSLSDELKPITIDIDETGNFSVRWYQHIRVNHLHPILEFSWDLNDWYPLELDEKAHFIEEINNNVNAWQATIFNGNNKGHLFTRISLPETAFD